jgi:hypothetical protein
LIFTVSFHETDGNNYNNEQKQCETAKQYLKNRIATHSIDFEPLVLNEKIINSDNFHDKKALIIDDSQVTIFNEIKQIY